MRYLLNLQMLKIDDDDDDEKANESSRGANELWT